MSASSVSGGETAGAGGGAGGAAAATRVSSARVHGPGAIPLLQLLAAERAPATNSNENSSAEAERDANSGTAIEAGVVGGTANGGGNTSTSGGVGGGGRSLAGAGAGVGVASMQRRVSEMSVGMMSEDGFGVFVCHLQSDAHSLAWHALYPILVLNGLPAYIELEPRCGQV